MLELLLHLTFVGASALAAGLIAYVVLATTMQLIRWVFARRQPRWLRAMRMLRVRAIKPPTGVKTNALPRWIALGLVLGLALKAFASGGFLVGAYLALVGIALYAYLSRRAASVGHETITDAVGELVAAYYSAYLVIPTVFGALDEAVKTLGGSKHPGHLQLQAAAAHAIRAFNAGQTTEEALDRMVDQARNPYLNQLAFILRHASESNQKEILGALRGLSERLEQRTRLKDKSRVALALVNGTVRFLQAANGAVIALAVFAPFWWDFYATSVTRQMLLMLGATVALGGSWYFEQQLTQIRERVL